MKRHVSIYGNVPLSIIHSFDYAHPFANNLLGRISFEWDHGFDTLDALNYKQHNKAVQDDRYNSSEDHLSASLDDNHTSYVNVKGNFEVYFPVPLTCIKKNL